MDVALLRPGVARIGMREAVGAQTKPYVLK